jgi:mRNA interferase RelE/StbE
LSNRFEIAETVTFQKAVNKPEFRKIYEKIRVYIYPQLRDNPYFGRNIKKLKGDLNDVYRYRIGDYRLFYSIDEKRIIVFVMDIIDRKDAY